ncbi:hypothetical protein ACWCYY_11430 [Kitasatospora sp. NPDC001664]
MAKDKRSWPLVHPLTYVRSANDWTLQQVASIVARRTKGAADRTKVWRWENWGVEPDLPAQLALADELAITSEQVHRLGWPGWLPDGEAIRTGFPWTSAGTLQALDDTLEHALLDRRGFMKLGGPALTGLAEQWLAVEPQALTAVLVGGRTSDDLVDSMEAGLPRLRRLEAACGGERARRLMDAELAIVTSILAESSYSAAAGRRLHRLAAELGRIAGFASFDAGLHAAAQRYWTTALRAAHTGADRAIGANILKSMSLQCYDHGLVQDSLALARSAVEGAGPVTPRTMAMLLLRQARAEAACGNRLACDRLLAAAESALDRSKPSDGDPSWTMYFDEAEFHAQAATCHTDLRRPAQAERAFATALALMPSAKTRDRATYVIGSAATHTALGDAEQAISLLESAVELIRDAPSQRNVTRAQRARSAIPLAKNDPRVEKLDAQFATLIA